MRLFMIWPIFGCLATLLLFRPTQGLRKRSNNMCIIPPNISTDSKWMTTFEDIAVKNEISQYMNNVLQGTNRVYDHDDYKLTVYDMNMERPLENGHVMISAPKLSDNDNQIDVLVPTQLFPNVPLCRAVQCRIGIITYRSDDRFVTNSSSVLMSKVIGAETAGCRLNMSSQLVIHFPVNSSKIIPGKQTLSCQFYNETANRWEDTGSFTNLAHVTSNNTAICSYNHMTPFAVLLVDLKEMQMDPEQWKILSYITYIGCSLSSFFSVVTIFLCVFMKSVSKDTSIRIHVSLSIALFLLNTSYLLIEWGATWSEESLCVFIAVIIQYSLLSCFSWMAIEAIHLYLLLVKLFNTNIKHYMVKLSLFGWGVPAVLVGGSLCVYNSQPFYGTTNITLSDTNETTKFCWITDSRLLYGMNISYFSLMFLLNTSILVIVTHQIFKMRSMKVTGSKLPNFKDFCTVLSLSFLLGITWGLAFLSSGYINYPILYLFCICNAFQGLLFCLWVYGTMKRNKHLES